MSINGHRILILGQDEELMLEGLDLIGADHVEQVDAGESQEEQVSTLNQLAESLHAGVVIAPGDVPVEDLVQSLRGQLPWVQ